MSSTNAPGGHDPRPCVTITVPEMVGRDDVRVVTASIRDVPGVVAVQAHLARRQIHVEGPVVLEAVRAAVLAAGYTVSDGPG